MERYTNHKLIGSGSYGNVYKAVDTVTGQTVAIKALKFEGYDIPGHLVREISVLRTQCHPNVISLVDIFLTKERHLSLVFEYVDQDLATYFRKHVQSEQDVRKIMYQILSALAYIHSHNIMHRDMKPENILITSAGVVKIADFGLSRPMSSSLLEDNVVTLWYRSPEILVGSRQYNYALDIWSVGCIFAELILQEPLFAGNDELSQLVLIFQHLGIPNSADFPYISNILKLMPIQPCKPTNMETFLHTENKSMVDQLLKLLQINQSTRICARDALAHPFFTPLQTKEAL